MDNLRYDDPFLVLADYASYVDCQDQVSAAWQDADSVDTDVDPQHRAQRQVLVGPGDRGVLRRDLERPPGHRQGGEVTFSVRQSGAQVGVSSE